MQNRALKYKNIRLEDYLLIDIREEQDYKTFHIKNSINIPDIVKISHIATENEEKKILLYCYHGNTANYYTQQLIQAGFKNIYFLQENYEDFQNLGIPLEYS